MTNISCQFEIYTYNTLCSRGPTKVLALSQINVPGGHLVFQNEAKNIPRQHFIVINISCKLEKASYNIFFVRAVMVKSLYTLRLSSGYNDLLNSENLKVAFYCVNTSYPMDNSLSGRRRPARQTSEKDVLCFHRLAGP